MKADPTTIGHLNAVLKIALTSVSQYFLHARMLGHWGFKRLEQHEFEASIRTMKNADKLIERILFLEGLPNLQDLGKLRNDLAMEGGYRGALAAAVGHCEQQGDYVSRHHLQELQEEAEEHIDWLETQLSLLKAVGLPNYLESAI